MRRLISTVIAMALLLAAGPAWAADSAEISDHDQQIEQTDGEAGELVEAPVAVKSVGTDLPNFAVTPRVGVTAPQLFTDLESWAVFGLDLGLILPFDLAGFDRPLQIGVQGTYTQPGATGEGTHPMLGEDGADYSWELTQRILTLQFNILWRFSAPGDGLGFHALVGPRAYLMESVMVAEGNDGQDFGENRETNTEYGIVFGGGAEFEIGPGSLVGTVQIGGSPLDQRITGDANTGAVELDLGYRMFF